MLKVDGLSGGYGHIRILWDISLSIEQGEIVTLLGANGAGKTTLIRTLAGELRPTNGSVTFLDLDITRARAHDIVEAALVEIPEGRQLWADLSIEDNLDLGAFCKHARRDLKATKDWIYSLFPILAERRRANARTLSGGQQQMLAIGRALMSKPKLLMLDEPSLGLAPQIVAELFEILITINDQDISILLVEQNVDFALRIADRAYVLEHGHITQQGNAAELLTSDSIRAAYLGI
jgi:branched-chain amino acid transport system ATP-binding protein